MNEEIYKVFGIHLKKFINKEFGTLRSAGEKLGVNHSYISQVINGHSQPSESFKIKLIKRGFDSNYFAMLEGINDIENLVDYQEIKFMYLELRKLLKQKDDIIRILEERIREIKGLRN